MLLPDGRLATHLDEIASRRLLDVAGREVGRAIAEIERGSFDVVRERHDAA
ncbi:hypothetical protein [Salinarimonas chemoclinalis]|uniref:hypothetical protein n=1 Tax=Salinarimonas chemoclinalis TaxID=3241599 RepID=UPI003555FD2D